MTRDVVPEPGGYQRENAATFGAGTVTHRHGYLSRENVERIGGGYRAALRFFADTDGPTVMRCIHCGEYP